MVGVLVGWHVGNVLCCVLCCAVLCGAGPIVQTPVGPAGACFILQCSCAPARVYNLQHPAVCCRAATGRTYAHTHCLPSPL